eukprot:11221364-Lingulodinium_polyedra.AAC.1
MPITVAATPGLWAAAAETMRPRAPVPSALRPYCWGMAPCCSFPLPMSAIVLATIRRAWTPQPGIRRPPR